MEPIQQRYGHGAQAQSAALFDEGQRIQKIRGHVVEETGRLRQQHPARLIVHIDGVR